MPLEKSLWQNNVWPKNKFGCQKICWIQKMLGTKTISGPKYKNGDQKKVIREMFGSKKWFDQKIDLTAKKEKKLSEKLFGPNEVLSKTNCLSKDIFGPKYFRVQNILCPKIFRIQNKILSK